MKKAFSVSSIIVFISLLLFPSCTGGLGDAPDIEAPVLTITSPVVNCSYLTASDAVSGTCSDNFAVSRITAVDVDSGASYPNAVISGNTWTWPVSSVSDVQGYHPVRFTAYDAAGNTSISSVKQITVIIDAEAPADAAWKIQRCSGIYAYFTPDSSSLESLDETDAAYKDGFQNVSFTVEGQLTDNIQMGITQLSIYDGNTLVRTYEPDSTTSSALYNPSYSIKASDLTEAEPSLKTGRHYLDCRITAKDDAGNSVSKDIGWFAWYPEYDKPHIIQNSVSGGIIASEAGNPLSIQFFDDDYLSYITWGTFASESEALSSISNPSDSVNLGNSKTLSSLRDSTASYTTSTTGICYLAALAEDSTGVWNSFICKLVVTDARTAIVVVSAPSENTIPAVSGNMFTVSGYTLDTAGCSSLKIAWVPDSISDKQASAQAALAADATAAGSSTKLSSGIRIWSLPLGSATAYNSTYKQQSFSCSMNLLADFTDNSQVENKDKFFEILAVNSTGNSTYQDYRLLASTTKPVITVSAPASNTVTANTGADYTITFTAASGSGTALTSVILYDETAAETALLTKTEAGTYSYTISAGSISEGTSTYRFYAKDALGNETTAQRSVVFTTLPILKTITTTKMSGTYKTGDVIPILATFSNTVYVSGSPYITLGNITDRGIAKTAEASYSSGSGSDTLTFNYTVESGDASGGITCVNAPVSLNGGSITATSGGSGSATLDSITDSSNVLSGKTIKIDAVQPHAGSVAISGTDSSGTSKTAYGSKYYFTSGDILTATVTASESVLVSGSPSLSVSAGTGKITFTFQSSSGSTMTFVHTVASADTNGVIAAVPNAVFDASALACITDTAGNQMTETGASSSPSSSACSIDTVSPDVPAMKLDGTEITATASYNAAKTLTVTDASADIAALYYSMSTPVSWTAYSSAVSLSDGTYYLTSYAVDYAGNKSSNSTLYKVTIDGAFPAVSELVCTTTAGAYKAGTTHVFKLSFADKVTATAEPYLTLSVKSSSAYVKVYATADTSHSTTVTFSYTVAAGDNSYDAVSTGIKIEGFSLDGITDTYGNTAPTDTAALAAYASKISSFDRTDIRICGSAPAISSVVPASGWKDENGRIAATGTSSNGNQLTITFDKAVYKESGNITLRRTAGWYLPSVFTESDFSAYYSSLSSTEKEYLYQTENGSIRLDSSTGQPYGPYKKITQGLNMSGTNAVPDTATKYVLDYQYSINDISTPAVTSIRTALEDAGYASQTLDVTSSSVVLGSDNKTVVVTFPNKLDPGIAWELVIDEGAFRDAAGNLFAGLAKGTAEVTAAGAGTLATGNTYAFWSDKVATPVIRVDRWSHGWGAQEPDASGTVTTVGANSKTVATTSMATGFKPTGYVRTRIDCQTPGAAVTYGTYGTTSDAIATSISNVSSSSTSIPDDAATADLTGTLTADTAYTGQLVLGDGTYTKPQKEYIKSRGTKTGFTDSDYGYEGAFKTIVIISGTGKYTDNKYLIIMGSTAVGGTSTISGFPLHDADPDERYGKYAYHPGGVSSFTSSNNIWYWTSYEVVSTFVMNSLRGNFSQTQYDTYCGGATCVYNFQYW